MCGIDAHFEIRQHLQLIQNPRHPVIHIQCQHGAAENIPDLTPAILQMPGNIAAHILNGITPCLCHLPVLFHSLRCDLRGAYPPAEILPGDLVVLPFLRCSGIPIRNLHLLLAPFLRDTCISCNLWSRSTVRTFLDRSAFLRPSLLPRGLSFMAVPPLNEKSGGMVPSESQSKKSAGFKPPDFKKISLFCKTWFRIRPPEGQVRLPRAESVPSVHR